MNLLNDIKYNIFFLVLIILVSIALTQYSTELLLLFMLFSFLFILLRIKKMDLLVNPIVLFFWFALLYIFIPFSRLPDITYDVISKFNINILYFKPNVITLFIYISSLILLVLSFIIGSRFNFKNLPDYHKFTNKISKLIIIVYLISVLAVFIQLFILHDIPLINVSSRWFLSPKLVYLASLQIILIPILNVVYPRKKKIILVLLLFSLILLSLLGARNLPIKLLIAFFITETYINKKNIFKISIFFTIGVLVIAFTVGILTKSGIYGMKTSALLGLGLFYTDSIGPLYNLQEIIEKSGPLGYFHGKLLFDTLFGIIPGTNFEYANYQIGSFLNGRQMVYVGGKLINRSVSLAPTFIGASYADFGFIGAYLNVFFYGTLLGILHNLAKKNIFAIPLLATIFSYLLVGINVGWYDPTLFIYIIATLIILSLLFLKVKCFPYK
ncbi:oligosaccharide repeat unit polymerase [Tepidibacillus fermentans]|uniref:Oligosaccharide repeat unit polymerase n=1 Tax=Tepidibacillus fermentans TaxID=1281767 RepID=A0A4R3KIK5_9BACI|nr:oligosaccharide repeat unit polymerase [Tepidibacillus fermentans]TCS83368.1 oligosaccharide repeat unit polymerase [Tepidibacillus fermentans]